MTSLHRNVSGVDWDDIFDLYEEGTKPSATSFRTSDGSDVVNRYAPIAYGTKAADVGSRTSAGLDVSNLFAKKGSAVYALPFDGKSYNASKGAATGETGTTSASRSISINSDGTWTVGGSGTTTNGGAVNGTWLPSGTTVSQWQVMFAGSPAWTEGASYGSSTNGASSYVAASTSRSFSISASVSSASTQSASGGVTVTVYLKNTGSGRIIKSTINLGVNVLGWR